MNTIILYPLLTTALYYLGAQAKVTEWLWSRYPPGLDRFMACAACSGYWYGILVGLLGAAYHWPFLGIPGRFWLTPILIGLAALVWTPLIARLHVSALMWLGGGATSEESHGKSS